MMTRRQRFGQRQLAIGEGLEWGQNRGQRRRSQKRPKRVFIAVPQVSFSDISPLWEYDFEWWQESPEDGRARRLEMITHRQFNPPSPLPTPPPLEIRSVSAGFWFTENNFQQGSIRRIGRNNNNGEGGIEMAVKTFFILIISVQFRKTAVVRLAFIWIATKIRMSNNHNSRSKMKIRN